MKIGFVNMSSVGQELCDEEIYNQILECYNKTPDDEIQKQVCKSKSILKVMEISDKVDKEVIKNSLILILSLYDDVDEPYPTLGTDIGDITDESEKEDFLNLLKEEFI